MPKKTPDYKNNENYKPLNGAKPLAEKPGMENFDPNEYLQYGVEAPTGEKFHQATPMSHQGQTFKGMGNPRKINRGKTKKTKK